MIDLYDTASDRHAGTISEAELELLVEALEEESSSDIDYFIDAGTIEMLETRGASAHLVALLRTAVGSSQGVELRWQRR